MRSETPYLLSRRCCGGSSRAHRRNREATQAEPAADGVPAGATVNVRLSVTVRVVPMAQSNVTELERIFMPHQQLAADLPTPQV